MSTDTIVAITEFWLGDSLDSPDAALARKDWWYAGGTTVDDEIRSRFLRYVEIACSRELVGWASAPKGALALILLLDQFTRNIYRHSPAAYRGDVHSLEIVKDVIANKLDRTLHPVERIWLYHPFHHAEQLDEQDYGLALLDDVRDAAPPAWNAYVNRSITGWSRHRDIVAQFGRFPHRNDVLSRTSTAEELAFLANLGEAFGQGKK